MKEVCSANVDSYVLKSHLVLYCVVYFMVYEDKHQLHLCILSHADCVLEDR